MSAESAEPLAGMRTPSAARALDCLLFDFGGTLDSDGIAWKERFEHLYRAEGAPLGERTFYDADDPLVGALDADVGLAETALRLIANLEAGLSRVDADRAERIAARFLDETAATVARNRKVLAALKTRYRLGIVSNFYGNLHGVCASLGLAELFDVMIDSEAVGAKKPDAAIFRAAMDPLGVAPARTMMVGDSLRRDRAGALNLGLDFVWIAPADAHAGADLGDHRAIASLDGLLEMLL